MAEGQPEGEGPGPYDYFYYGFFDNKSEKLDEATGGYDESETPKAEGGEPWPQQLDYAFVSPSSSLRRNPFDLGMSNFELNSRGGVTTGPFFNVTPLWTTTTRASQTKPSSLEQLHGLLSPAVPQRHPPEQGLPDSARPILSPKKWARPRAVPADQRQPLLSQAGTSALQQAQALPSARGLKILPGFKFKEQQSGRKIIGRDLDVEVVEASKKGQRRMASTESGDNISTGCTTPNSNANYDSDARSDCVEELLPDTPYHICALCNQPYSNPMVLICLHTFCLQCMGFLQKGNEIHCKKCRTITHLETGSVEADLIVDFARRRYIDQLTFNNEDNLICRSCNLHNQALFRCYECHQFLCNNCKDHHIKLLRYADHTVNSLNDAFKTTARKTLMCGEHPEQPHDATLYCYTCRMARCELSQHQYFNPSHKVVSLDDCTSFKEVIFSIEIEKSRAHATMKVYSGGMERMSRCQRNAVEEIETHAQQAKEAIDVWCKAMIESVSKQVNDTAKEATKMVKSSHDFFRKLDAVLKYMEDQNKYAQSWDNIQTKPFIEKALKVVNNSKPDNVMKLTFDFTFIGKNPVQDIHDLGYIVNTPPPPDPQIPGYQQPIARPTSMNRSTANQNHATDSYHSSVNGLNNYRQYNSLNQQPQGHRSSNIDQSNDMTQSQYASYDLQRARQLRNSYDPFPGQSYPHSSSSPMTVSQPNSASMVNDNVFDFNLQPDSTNRNYTVNFVSTQHLDQPYKAWSNGIDQPGSSCAPPMDDIFTRSSYFQSPEAPGGTPDKEKPREFLPHVPRKKMQFVYKFGEYGNSQGQFTEPSGVAVDNENRLVVADTNNSRIQVFDIRGEFLSQYSNTLTAKLTYPNRIAVSRRSGKVVITERAPSHRVQTYTSEGRHLKTFGEEILQHPRGVAVDEKDNIIVIECKVMRVTIFTMEGQMLDQFSLSKDLQFPNSVAVNDKQEIFISDNRSHCVKVFSYEGKMLRTIGGEGITHYPIAVAINQRNQVVVADNHNNFNITVFDQQGKLMEAFESKTKHAQCFDMALTNDGLAILTSKDFKVYCYPYQEDSPHQPHMPRSKPAIHAF